MIPLPPIPSSAKRTPTFKLPRFRSLSVLRTKTHTRTADSPPTPGLPSKKATKDTTVAERKKAAYPPTFAAEIAIMQFVDGGSVDANARKLLQNGESAYRDEKGAIWWDADEELEYTHLLAAEEPLSAASTTDAAENWVRFEGDSSSTQIPETDVPQTNPGLSVLCLPSRPRRGLGKPTFLLDTNMAPFAPKSPTGVTPTNTTPSSSSGSGKTERRRPAPLVLGTMSNTLQATQNAARKATARTLVGLSPLFPKAGTSTARVIASCLSPRHEFLAGSFSPTTRVDLGAGMMEEMVSPNAEQGRIMKASRVRLPQGMRALFTTNTSVNATID